MKKIKFHGSHLADNVELLLDGIENLFLEFQFYINFRIVCGLRAFVCLISIKSTREIPDNQG